MRREEKRREGRMEERDFIFILIDHTTLTYSLHSDVIHILETLFVLHSYPSFGHTYQ